MDTSPESSGGGNAARIPARPNRPPDVVLNLSGVDLSSDESIERWAEEIWPLVMKRLGIDVSDDSDENGDEDD